MAELAVTSGSASLVVGCMLNKPERDTSKGCHGDESPQCKDVRAPSWELVCGIGNGPLSGSRAVEQHSWCNRDVLYPRIWRRKHQRQWIQPFLTVMKVPKEAGKIHPEPFGESWEQLVPIITIDA